MVAYTLFLMRYSLLIYPVTISLFSEETIFMATRTMTYAYSKNIYSSGKIETVCKRDINFMWLLAGQKAPDHSTIVRFSTGFLADACEDFFY